MNDTPAKPTRIALVGGRGFGAVHLRKLAQYGEAVELVAVADPRGAEPGTIADVRPTYATFDELLAAHDGIDIVVIATPIDSHGALAEQAMRAGADVYLEKPPVTSRAAFDRLLAVQAETGRAVQVGFQSLGSLALDAFADDRFGIGEIWSISAVGLWLRAESYWKRSAWAGKRVIDGRDVVDGVATNPLAHATATALALAGTRRTTDVDSVDAELARANTIESDDTTTISVHARNGIHVFSALTLCAPQQQAPRLTIRGTKGEAVFHYTTDTVTDAAGNEHHFERRDLLRNLIEHRETAAPLLSSLVDSGAFMEVLETIRTAPAPRQIPEEFIEWREVDGERNPVIDDIEWRVERSAAQRASFSTLRAPWAAPVVDVSVAELTVDGAEVARYLDGASVTTTSSPRPYLHPIATRSGIVVSDHHPSDHDWHLGLSFAIQHVDETNFWGGRTYLRDRGYVWRPDQGVITGDEPQRGNQAIDQRLRWIAASGVNVFDEQRRIGWHAVGDRAWALDVAVSLHPSERGAAVTVGSPGSRGRVGGGYGGFAWRVAPCTDIDVRTADASGEDAVHGTRSSWLAWSARFEGGEATIVLLPGADSTVHDPWFVRAESYPGIGTAVAWDADLAVTADAPLERSIRAIVADGRLNDDEVVALIEAAR